MSVTVYVCKGCSNPCGTSATVKALDEYRTSAGSRLVAASRSRTVEEFTVVGSSGLENTALGATPAGMASVPFIGVTERTCRGAVVKLHATLLARALPARSFTRGSVLPPLTRATYVVSPNRSVVGCSVAVNELVL
jgi:hypothetical protein